MLWESDVNPMTTSNMMIYRSQTCIWAYGHVLLAWPGVHVSSTYHILSMMKKRSHALSTELLLMMCMCTEEIPSLKVSPTTVDKISINHLKENPPNICGFGRSQPQEPQKS